jgi:hypothetical protein
MSRLGLLAFAGFLASSLLGGGCATPARPGQEIAKAELAIREAQTSGEASAQSAAELQLARDKLARAQRAEREDQHALARRLAAEAAADAQLAEVRAEANAARETLVQIENRP